MDACINGHLIEALAREGWDMARAIDLYPEGTPDPLSSPQPRSKGARSSPTTVPSSGWRWSGSHRVGHSE
jgi:hypothetical protein